MSSKPKSLDPTKITAALSVLVIFGIAALIFFPLFCLRTCKKWISRLNIFKHEEKGNDYASLHDNDRQNAISTPLMD